MDGCTYGRTFETGFIRWPLQSRRNKVGLKCPSICASVPKHLSQVWTPPTISGSKQTNKLYIVNINK